MNAYINLFFLFLVYVTANKTKVSHLVDLQGLGELKLYQADLTDEGSFDEAISGCDIVFHVATPVHFESKDPEVTKFLQALPNGILIFIEMQILLWPNYLISV